jgi:hypothetical protein
MDLDERMPSLFLMSAARSSMSVSLDLRSLRVQLVTPFRWQYSIEQLKWERSANPQLEQRKSKQSGDGALAKNSEVEEDGK